MCAQLGRPDERRVADRLAQRLAVRHQVVVVLFRVVHVFRIVRDGPPLLFHAVEEERLPEGFHYAYDGLVLEA